MVLQDLCWTPHSPGTLINEERSIHRGCEKYLFAVLQERMLADILPVRFLKVDYARRKMLRRGRPVLSLSCIVYRVHSQSVKAHMS